MKKTPKNSLGFTIVELLVVLTVLGVLVATAGPRLLNLQGDARRGVMEGVEAAVRGATSMVHAKALLAGISNGDLIIDSNLTIKVIHYYPTRNYVDEIVDLKPKNDFTHFNVMGGNAREIRHAGALYPEECKVIYTQPASLEEKPIISTEFKGC